MAFHFEILKKDDRTGARLGRCATPHGIFNTPAFIPVGTQATVKGITPEELRDSYVMLYQDVQPAAQAEDEQDRLALAAPVETSEEDVLRALQQEAEAQRDERY